MKAMVLAVLLTTSMVAHGMDRWAALSQIESGDNDRAVGHAGEVSRYQIKPALWCVGEPCDCNAALENAQRIMQARTAEFLKRFGREATDFEFYVLWNAPGQIEHPSGVVKARAERFANLCSVREPVVVIAPQLNLPSPATVLSQTSVVPQSAALPQSVVVAASQLNLKL